MLNANKTNSTWRPYHNFIWPVLGIGKKDRMETRVRETCRGTRRSTKRTILSHRFVRIILMQFITAHLMCTFLFMKNDRRICFAPYIHSFIRRSHFGHRNFRSANQMAKCAHNASLHHKFRWGALFTIFYAAYRIDEKNGTENNDASVDVITITSHDNSHNFSEMAFCFWSWSFSVIIATNW